MSATSILPATRPMPRPWHQALWWLALCLRRQRTRGELRDLCPHLLRDLGLTEGEALREARKPFWRD